MHIKNLTELSLPEILTAQCPITLKSVGLSEGKETTSLMKLYWLQMAHFSVADRPYMYHMSRAS